MAVLTEVQRAKGVLDVVHSADTATGVDVNLAVRIAKGVVTARGLGDPEEMTNEELGTALIGDLRKYYRQILKDSEATPRGRTPSRPSPTKSTPSI